MHAGCSTCNTAVQCWAWQRSLGEGHCCGHACKWGALEVGSTCPMQHASTCSVAEFSGGLAYNVAV